MHPAVMALILFIVGIVAGIVAAALLPLGTLGVATAVIVILFIYWGLKVQMSDRSGDGDMLLVFTAGGASTFLVGFWLTQLVIHWHDVVRFFR